MEKLGPATAEVLEQVSKPLCTTGYWTVLSRCGNPKIIMIDGKRESHGAKLAAHMIAARWDIGCCGSACYGFGNHLVEYLTIDQIKKLGFHVPGE